MTDKHQPSEAEIEAILATYTPRQTAIAYLRASHKLRSPPSDIIETTLSGLEAMVNRRKGGG
jgi:hypothetical protein